MQFNEVRKCNGEMATVRIVCFVLSCISFVAHAQDHELSSIQLSFENDVLGSYGKGRATDKWYTNGLRGAWSYKDAPYLTYSIGHSMYTPSRIRVSSPLVNDRPWGAFLYGGIASETDAAEHFQATELKLGWIGKYAGGYELQRIIHGIGASGQPRGWDQQLGGRLGMQLTHAQVLRLGGDTLRAQLNATGSIGTLRNYASLGGSLLYGNFASKEPPILIANEGDFIVHNATASEQSLPYAFLSMNVNAVASNYFISGKTPFGHSNLALKHSYSMFQWGVSVPLERWLWQGAPRLLLAQTRKTAEFEFRVPATQSRVHRWGSIMLHWNFK